MGDWRKVILITVCLGVFCLLLVYLDVVIPVVALGVLCFLAYMQNKEQKTMQSNMVYAARLEQLWYACRLILFNLFQDHELAVRLDVVRPQLLDKVPLAKSHYCAGVPVFRFSLLKSVVRTFDCEDLELFKLLVQREFETCLESGNYLAEPHYLGDYSVMTVLDVYDSQNEIHIYIALLPDAQAASTLSDYECAA